MLANNTDSTISYIAIAGPTASGKSAASMHLAQYLAQHQINVEIVSVDSACIYRGMDIGTDKPRPEELTQVPHHLINIIEPHENYSAAQFARDAHRIIHDVQARGKLALLVGGTMLYFKALFNGLSTLPAADNNLREQFTKLAQKQGWQALHKQLAAVDEVTAARLKPTDSQRISRALEVWHITGKPISYWHEKGSQELKPALPITFLSLEPTDRSWLHERIAQRVDSMLQRGFMQEVQQLMQRGNLHANLPSMRCVGYRQTWQAIENQETIPILREKIIAATRQLAKRQLTWLRSMPHHHVLDCDKADMLQHLTNHVHRVLRQKTKL